MKKKNAPSNWSSPSAIFGYIEGYFSSLISLIFIVDEMKSNIIYRSMLKGEINYEFGK